MLLFEAPKISPAVLIFLESVSFATSAYTDNIHSLLMAIQKVYLICVLFLISVFFILSHSLSFFRFIFAGGMDGGEGVITINLILGYKGEPPKKICNKKGGLHVLQELPVNFHQPRLPNKK